MPLSLPTKKNTLAFFFKNKNRKDKKFPFNFSVPNQSTETSGKSDSFGRLDENKRRLIAMQEALSKSIDNLGENQSLFSHGARLWGRLPFLIKIGLFFVLTLPFLITSAFVYTPIFLTVAGFVGVGFLIAAILLENHYQTSRERTKNLKRHMAGFAEMLSETILALEHIHIAFEKDLQQLDEEILKFKRANHKLSSNISTLHGEVDTLSGENKTLHNNIEELSHKVTDFNELLEAYQKEREKFAECNKELSKNLELEYENINILSKAITEISKLRDADADVAGTLQNFLSMSREAILKLDDGVESIKKENAIYRNTNQLFEENNSQYQALIQQQKQVLSTITLLLQNGSNPPLGSNCSWEVRKNSEFEEIPRFQLMN